MTAKETYRKFCQRERALPLFVRDWWLDAVCGEMNWDAVIVENGGQIVATMPYYIKKKFGQTLLRMPPLTQILGPWIRPIKGKYSNRLSYEKGVMTALIEQLPSFDNFQQSWNYNYTNWLPFYWKGFAQTTSYTYVIDDLSNLDRVWEEMQPNIRNKIRKAEKSGIRVVECDDIETFLDLNELTFKRQGLSLLYSRDFVRALNAACIRNNARKIYITVGPDGLPQSGLFCVYDGLSMYNLMQGRDHRTNSGSNALAIWESIKFASTTCKMYDFEGSMIESVETFFRGFGAVQKPVFCISKTNSILLHTAFVVRDLLKLLVSKADYRKP